MKRNYGIDLLRLVLMYMVVLVHILGTGGVVWTAPPFSGQYWAAWSLDALCYCSVNSFALITGYVHYGTKYKVSSILSLTAQAFFYSASITLLCALFEPDRIRIRPEFEDELAGHREMHVEQGMWIADCCQEDLSS